MVNQGYFERLFELMARLAQCTDLMSVLDEVLKASIEVVNADAGYIRLFEPEQTDPEQNRYPFVACQGISDGYLGYFSSLPQPVDVDARRQVFEGRRIIVEDMMTHSSFLAHRDVVLAEGYTSLCSTPLMSRNGSRCLGSVVTYTRELSTPDQRDLAALDLYAELAATAIEQHARVATAVHGQTQALQFVSEVLEAIETNPADMTLDEISELAASARPVIGDALAKSGSFDDPNPGEEGARCATAGEALTYREIEALLLGARGLSDEVVAQQLGVSRFTLAKYVGAAARKMEQSAGEPAQASDFGELLRAFRFRAGLTQRELAERAQISYRTISDLERGIRTKTYVSTVRMLSEALALSPEDSDRMAGAVNRSRRRPLKASL